MKITQGWDLCLQWKDGSASGEPLADLKESYLIDIAEYTDGNKIERKSVRL